MKKVLAVLLVMFLVAFATACAPKEETSAPTETTAAAVTDAPSAEGALVDGTYTASYSHTDTRGWRPFMTMEVKNGKIASAIMDYANLEGKLKSEDQDYAKNMSAKTKVTPKEAYDQMNAAAVEKQSANIDAVTGATHSSEYFKHMTEALIEQAKVGDTKELIVEHDGNYTAKGETDERGWTPQITLTYEGGKIVAAVYDEVNAEGAKKSEDAAYGEKMKAASGTSQTEAYAALQTALVEKQDADAVDAVTGATTTSTHFVELAKKAMATRVAYK